MLGHSDERTRRQNLLPFIIIALIVAGLRVAGQDARVYIGDKIAGTVFYPFFRLNLYISNIDEILTENEVLLSEIAGLTAELSSLREKARENDRLREMLGFVRSTKIRGVPAEVVARAEGSGFNGVVINIGSSAGVKKNATVISTDGLVGKVVDVYSESGIVQFLTDPNCKVAALEGRTRTHGIIRWEEGSELVFGEVPNDRELAVGDSIFTSGLGGIFPKGLFIGLISDVRTHKEELFQHITVEPATRFDDLEEVYVMMPGEPDRE